jgi:hypothetical protein
MALKRTYMVVLLGIAGGLSGVLSVLSASIPYVASGWHDDLFVGLLPGALFGATISGCLWLCGWLPSNWKCLIILGASSVAYFAALFVAAGVERFSPLILYQDRGDVAGESLFAGGFTGTFLTVGVLMLAAELNRHLENHNRFALRAGWGCVGRSRMETWPNGGGVFLVAITLRTAYPCG